MGENTSFQDRSDHRHQNSPQIEFEDSSESDALRASRAQGHSDSGILPYALD